MANLNPRSEPAVCYLHFGLQKVCQANCSFCSGDLAKTADLIMRVQHRFGGMRDAGCGMRHKNRGGMRDTRNIEGGIRDEKSLAGSGCAHFKWWNAG